MAIGDGNVAVDEIAMNADKTDSIGGGLVPIWSSTTEIFDDFTDIFIFRSFHSLRTRFRDIHPLQISVQFPI